MKRLVERGERIARVEAAETLARAADAAREVVPPGVAIEALDGALCLIGRRLGERWAGDPRLRALGLELRSLLE